MGNEASQQAAQGAEIPNDMSVSWNKVENSLAAREGHSSCVVGKNLFLYGGVVSTPDGGFSESNDLLKFDSVSSEFKALTPKGDHPAPRSSASMSSVGNNVYLFGGISQETGWFSLDDIHVYNTETETWSTLTPSGAPPSPRDKHATVTIKNKIYLFGGFGPKFEEEDVEEVSDFSEDDEAAGLEAEQQAAQFGWFNDLFVFDPESNSWSNPLQMNLGVPTPRAAFGMCSVDKHLVIFGGKDSVARQNDIHIFDTESRRWLTDLKWSGRAPEPRSFHTTTTVDTRVVVIGGRGLRDQHFSDIHVFDTKTREWLQPKVDGESPAARGVHSVCVVNDNLVLYGGSSNFNKEIMQCTKYLGDLYTMRTDHILKGSSTSDSQKSSQKRKLDASEESTDSPCQSNSPSNTKIAKEDSS